MVGLTKGKKRVGWVKRGERKEQGGLNEGKENKAGDMLYMKGTESRDLRDFFHQSITIFVPDYQYGFN